MQMQAISDAEFRRPSLEGLRRSGKRVLAKGRRSMRNAAPHLANVAKGASKSGVIAHLQGGSKKEVAASAAKSAISAANPELGELAGPALDVLGEGGSSKQAALAAGEGVLDKICAERAASA